MNDDQSFEDLLEYLKSNRSFDFTGYKRSSLMRRVLRRIQQVPEVETFSEYRDYLEVHPDEFVPLFNTILINVTDFFRDPNAWEFLAQHVIPEILQSKGKGDPIRVSSVGCACGKEAYSIAMLLAEALGLEQYRQRVKIFATDVDEEALASARHAVYPSAALKGVAPELRDKYFERGPGDQVTFKTDFRRGVIFGRHDLVQDAPISRLDLLICRNTLMYLNAEIQSRALARFHFALNDPGYLFLGKAEMLVQNGDLFSPIDIKHRIFLKVTGQSARDRVLMLGHGNGNEPGAQIIQQLLLREVVFDALPVAQIVVAADGKLLLASAAAREMFDLKHSDLGRPLAELELSYRPIELRSLIDQATAERRTVLASDIPVKLRRGETEYLDVQVVPVYDSTNRQMGTTVNFINVTAHHRLQETLEHSNQEMETANEELQSTNEELETTNEELQSTNEELETTNEELQSTNEELETMNEELQATNEELQTTNDELKLRTDEVNQLNGFLQCIMASLPDGLVVVDRKFIVLSWNKSAENLWGIKAQEAQGESIFNLDIGLPLGQLKQFVRDCLEPGAQSSETTIDATNRRGQPIRCRVSFSPLTTGGRLPDGVILVMEELK